MLKWYKPKKEATEEDLEQALVAWNMTKHHLKVTEQALRNARHNHDQSTIARMQVLYWKAEKLEREAGARVADLRHELDLDEGRF